MGKLQVNLLGTNFTVHADDDDQHLEKILHFYEDILKDVEQIPTVKTPLQISILAGLSVCDEVFKLKQANSSSKQNSNQPTQNYMNEENSEEIERRTIAMIDKISRVL